MHADAVIDIRCMPKQLGARDWQKLQAHLLEGNKLHTFSFFGSSLYQFQYIGLFVHACITYKNMSSLSVHAHVHTPQHNKYTHTHNTCVHTTHTRNTHTHTYTHIHTYAHHSFKIVCTVIRSYSSGAQGSGNIDNLKNQVEEVNYPLAI